MGDIWGYHPSNIPQFSNLMPTTINLCLKFNSRQDNILWLLQRKGNLFVYKVIPEKTQKKKYPQQIVSCSWTFFVHVAKYLKDKKHSSLYFAPKYIKNSWYLVQKYAWIFVCGHYLFRDEDSFARAKLKENCELWSNKYSYSFVMITFTKHIY